MGVDLEGDRARAAKARARGPDQPPGDTDFSKMRPEEVQEYWNRVRANRLGRAQGRQDDEVVGIAGAYLVATAVILVLAVLSQVV